MRLNTSATFNSWSRALGCRVSYQYIVSMASFSTGQQQGGTKAFEIR